MSTVKPKSVKQAERRQNPDKLKVDARNNFISRVRAGKSYRPSTLATYGLTEESLQAELAKRASPIATTKVAISQPRTVEKVPVVSPSASKSEAKQSNEADIIRAMQAVIDSLTNEVANLKAELEKAKAKTPNESECAAELEKANQLIEKLKPAPPPEPRKIYSVADYLADMNNFLRTRYEAELIENPKKKLDMQQYNIIRQYLTAMDIPDSANVIELFSYPDAFYARAKKVKKLDGEPYTQQTWNKNFKKFDMSIFHSPILQVSLPKAAKDRFKQLYQAGRDQDTALQLTQRNTIITPIEETYELAVSRYGQNSPQAFLVLLYMNAPARDDYGLVVYVKKLADATNKDLNYLVVDTAKKSAILVFNKYKMAYKAGTVTVDISDIYRDVTDYIRAAKLSLNDFLFQDSNRDYKLSQFAGKFLKELGVNTGKQSIYYLRHAAITRLQQDDRFTSDSDYIQKVAKISMHSVAQNQTYTRSTAKFIIDDLLKNDNADD